MYKRSNLGWEKHLDFILLDMLSSQTALVIAYMIRHGWGQIPYLTAEYRMLALFLALLDLGVAVMFNTMHGVLHRGYFIEFVQTLKQVLLVFAALSIILFALKTSSIYSRVTLFITAPLYLVISYLIRIGWKRQLELTGNQQVRSTMLLVGEEASVREALAQSQSGENARILGLVLTNRDAEGETLAGLPVVANLSGAANYICREWVDEVFFAFDTLPNLSEEAAEPGTAAGLIRQCREMAIPTHIRVSLAELEGKSFVERFNGFSVITTTSNYASPFQLLAKRLLDLLGGLVGSLFTLLLMLVVGPMIKMQSPGPILFRQERIGQNGKHFKMFKLRTMVPNADALKQELMNENRVTDGMMFKLDFDPRIIGNRILPDGTKKTGIGDFLRRTSLDEFPQFFNVVLGEMSLVGTRPPTLDEWERYELHHRARLAFRPGMTGMWQVSGRSRITDFEEVVKLDTEYINNWSFGLDLKILLQTIRAVFKHDGAM